MIWGGVNTVQVQVVEPLAHLLDTMGEFNRIVNVRRLITAGAHVETPKGITLG
jgi:hypothetical protein